MLDNPALGDLDQCLKPFPLCVNQPPRWCVRVDGIPRFFSLYAVAVEICGTQKNKRRGAVAQIVDASLAVGSDSTPFECLYAPTHRRITGSAHTNTIDVAPRNSQISFA